MAYAVTDACIRCKYMDCVDVCPVDCFHEGHSMLVIDPELCIDCGVCEPECPAGAIVADTAPEAERWLALNRRQAAVWPTITVKGVPPADADRFKGMAGKYERFFAADTEAAEAAGSEGGPRRG